MFYHIYSQYFCIPRSFSGIMSTYFVVHVLHYAIIMLIWLSEFDSLRLLYFKEILVTIWFTLPIRKRKNMCCYLHTILVISC